MMETSLITGRTAETVILLRELRVTDHISHTALTATGTEFLRLRPIRPEPLFINGYALNV